MSLEEFNEQLISQLFRAECQTQCKKYKKGECNQRIIECDRIKSNPIMLQAVLV